MHNALLARVDVIKLNAELDAVLAQRGNLFCRDLIQNIEPALNRRRHIVIHRGDGPVGTAHLAAGEAQTLKSLRRGDLVQKLQVDVKNRGLAFGLDHYVLLPDLLK